MAWRERKAMLEKTGELEIIRWFARAVLAGAKKEAVKVRVAYELGRITRQEAEARLRELAKGDGRGRRAG